MAKFEAEANIIFSQTVDCPGCGVVIPDVEFDTGAVDEDGLCDVTPEDLVVEVVCLECGRRWDEAYSGWTSYGEA